jgi:hypothetical protein
MNILKLMLCGSLLTTISFSADTNEFMVNGVNTGTVHSTVDPETDAYVDSLTNPDTPFIDDTQNSINQQLASEVAACLIDDLEETILPTLPQSTGKSNDYSAVSTDNSGAKETKKIDTTSSAEITYTPQVKEENKSQSYFCCPGIF